MPSAIEFHKDDYFPFHFPMSQAAWERYQPHTIELPSGARVGSAEQVYRLRGLAARMNARRDFSQPGTPAARAGDLAAMGLLNEIFRHLLTWYAESENPGVLARAMAAAARVRGEEPTRRPREEFVKLFPPQAVRDGRVPAEQYLQGRLRALSNHEIVTRELLLLSLCYYNPCLVPYRELFDDTELNARAPYSVLNDPVEDYLNDEPPLPEFDLPILKLLRKTIDEGATLEGQLALLRDRFAPLLTPELLDMVMLSTSLLREENAWRGFGPGPLRVLRFGLESGGGYPEPEAFTPDTDWMPNVVLIAKTVYVWLDQLSKRYKRPITRLDQVPDEELDTLGRWGFNGLWLIGIWERSPTSRQIKQMMGNPDAAASAYSLYDYIVAHDIGGDEAYGQLAERAWRRGIRMATDMVPNHVGIYSKWVVEHPDWFVQLPYPPFPGYTYHGPNLSPDDRVTIQIEDGYWEKRDAAVTFKWINNATGETRYIYHGNDGTNMAWNDTAQLNYLLPEVREAVTQTILHVARKSPIIRFDAAMTLAKKHYQRLWYPTGDAENPIPSRAEYGMSREEFDRVFPKEFWREVVDRVAAEAPDTLLLAEAFWLMEGYFVRTLGMHRVYNSAFMNMLKLEENAKYRTTIKNVLEFSGEVLQRFVNFMNNPDEKTAVEQFGKDDKYFGVCMMMATMPGLPMFGHGQIEGYAEKYGMEYRRAYWDEQPDQHLIWRHEREIFPLVRKRYLFSGARDFTFFDFIVDHAWVNENVYAYANRKGDESALIVFNNAYQATSGHIKDSTPINLGSAENKRLINRSLIDALGLRVEPNCYYIYRDLRAGLEYLIHSQQIAEYGLHFELGGYQYYVLLEWRAVYDYDLSWARLHGELQGRGVASVEDAFQELVLADILAPFRVLLSGERLNDLVEQWGLPEDAAELEEALQGFFEAVSRRIGREDGNPRLVHEVLTDLQTLAALGSSVEAADLDAEVAEYLLGTSADDHELNGNVLRPTVSSDARALLVWTLLRRMGALARLEPELGDDAPATDAAESLASVEAEEADVPVNAETASARSEETLAVGELSEAEAATEASEAVATVRTQTARAEAAYARALEDLQTSAAWMREWYLVKNIGRAFGEMDGNEWQGMLDAHLVRICTAHVGLLDQLAEESWGPVLYYFFNDPDVRSYTQMNQWGGRVWIRKESFEQMLRALFRCWFLVYRPEGEAGRDAAAARYEALCALREAAVDSNYDVDTLLSAVK